MSDDEKMTLNEFPKKIAIKTNGGIWSVLDKTSPSEEELGIALEMAYTSMYHWKQVGKPINIARGEYMVSRVLSDMGKQTSIWALRMRFSQRRILLRVTKTIVKNTKICPKRLLTPWVRKTKKSVKVS